MFERAQLIANLHDLHLVAGDVVMLHASMRAIGNVRGGPDEVLQSILEVISPAGTLMMYVGCEPDVEIVGRHKLSQSEEAFILEHSPVFNPATARARRDYGILAEYFRSMPGVLCSDNPGARIAAMGKLAEWLTQEHGLSDGYGPGTPLAKLYERNGKLLLVGSDLDQVTLLHYAEHIAPITEKRRVHCRVPLLKNNQRVWCDVEEYDTSIGIRQWPERFFASIVMQFIEQHSVRAMKVGKAESYLLEARPLVDFAVTKMVEAATHYSC